MRDHLVQPPVQFVRGTVAHALQAQIPGGYLNDDGQIPARLDGHDLIGHLYAQNADRFFRQAKTVVFLGGIPLFHMDDHIDGLGKNDGADAVHGADVDDADAADLHEVADHFG